MNRPTINPENLLTRLKFYNIKYTQDGTTLKISLPFLCYLKIVFNTENVKMTSFSRIGFKSVPLEYNFLIYGLALFTLAWCDWSIMNHVILILGGFIISYLIVCFIKIESMKSIIYNWLEISHEK